MKTRPEIKTQARVYFTSRYWPVVGIGVLGVLLVNAISAIPFVGWLLSLLVGVVISVGVTGFYLNVYRGHEIKVGNLFSPFNRYGRVLGGMLWMCLWRFIWGLIFFVPFLVYLFSLLFSSLSAIYDPEFNYLAIFSNPAWLLLLLLLIPFIIKSLSYFLAPYILADSPNVAAIDALTLSKKMMEGYKWKLFVAHLTFSGWFAIIVGIGLFGIFLIHSPARMDQSKAILLASLVACVPCYFFIMPYYQTTMAGFYDEIKEQAKQKPIPGTEAL